MSGKAEEKKLNTQEKTEKEKAESCAEDEEDSDAGEESTDESGSESSSSVRSDCAECPICLRSLTSQNVGFPEDCASQQHIFCAECIEEWSKNVTTCPIDRIEFTSICIWDTWASRKHLRTIKVVRKEYDESDVIAIEEDLTYCEICHQAHREHMMLLCDDCDKGFHMDCLTPALREIPAGSWFCFNCDPDTAESSNAVLSDSEDDVPRIIRTRQSERIRAAILVRNRIVSPEPQLEEPGPSRIASTLERVKKRLTARRKTKRRRGRRRVRVTVEEYEINSADEKFPIRRTRKVRTRRRKIKKRKGKRVRKSCSNRTENNNDDGLSMARIRAGVPTLNLFEPSNNLDYFSDENDEIVEPLEDQTSAVSSGNVMTVIRNVRPIGNISRTMLKRKVAIVAPTPDPINILDMIMENQEKLHSKMSPKVPHKKPKITQAPLNEPAAANGNSTNLQPTTAANHSQETSNNNNNNRTQNSSATTSTTSTAAVTSSNASGSTSGNGENGGGSGDPVRFSYVPLPQRKQTTPKKSNTADMFDEEEENCPNFSVYSSETMNLAKKEENNPVEKQVPQIETDVDLVQLSEDEQEDESAPKESTANKWKPISEEPAKEEGEPERSRVLQLYDSDGENADWNKETNATGAAEEEQERSYTPCLDENQPKENEGNANETSRPTGIDGMDTELISDEEDSNLNEQLEPFKRGLKAKERNYREKRSKSPRNKRSRSAEDKENKGRRPRESKKELPRYDVRNVIEKAKATQRDPFGRNKERNRSKSRPRRSRSLMGSRKSFSMSRSPSYDRPAAKRRRSRSRSKRRSSTPRRRSISPRRRSPVGHRPGRSVSRSVSPLRRRDLPRRRSSSQQKRRKGRKDKRKRQKTSKERKRKGRSRSGSGPPARGWSRNGETPPLADQSWTPPIAGPMPKTAENLRVVVNNRETPVRTKKKEKKRKGEKKKEKRSKEKNKHRHEKTAETSARAAAASKEIFASGDNILVSVSFNNVQEKTKTPERRVERDPSKILQLPAPAPQRVQRRHRKIDAKPVAIIDLDGSPFNEIPPSPVIILSDSEHDANDLQQKKNSEVTLDEVIRPAPASPPESPAVEEQFRLLSHGPKTPPEPPQLIKFSMPTKTSRIRQINTIFEQENDDDEASDEAQNQPSQPQNQKIGPNTPPEPTPKSPDVYDPFEPTKSPSEHSGHDDDDDHPMDDGPPSRSSTPPLEETEANLSKEAAEKNAASMNPVDLVMSLINKNSIQQSHDGDTNNTITIESMDEIKDSTQDDGEKQIQVLSQVVVTPMKGGGTQYSLHPASRTSASTTTPLKTPTRSPATYKPSGTQGGAGTNKNKIHSGSIISKLPLPRKPETSAPIEIDSPYSPGSCDFDDLFEPPSSTTDTYKPMHKQQNVTSTSNNNRLPGLGMSAAGGKVDVFDNLFGSTSPPHKFSTVTTTYKSTTKVTRRRKRRSRKIEDDEIPSSAVELQVKDKLLRKLNRQERVIEEVKLVIKPHYNKKRISKEEYKEIMRKAVPKIYHSKSGEINPVKIQTLVEAYVKKVRYRRKMQNKLQTT